MGLTTHVYVTDEHYEAHGFAPGAEVPEWAARKMGAHCFEGGVHPYPEQGTGDVEVPARSGPKSGAQAWRDYATGHGVVVPTDAKRDDIIAACDAAGVPTE